MQRERYGLYPESLTNDELTRYFHLDDDDREWIATKRRDSSRCYNLISAKAAIVWRAMSSTASAALFQRYREGQEDQLNALEHPLRRKTLSIPC